MSDDMMPSANGLSDEPVRPAALNTPPPATRRQRREGRRSRKGRIFVVLAFLCVVLVLPLALVIGWYWLQVHPLGKPGAVQSVEVQKGWGVADIGDELAKRGVIGSPLAFRVYVGIDGNATFSAGRYELRKHMGIADAATKLHAGPIVTYGRLALPPGLTLEEIAARVGAQPGLSKERFLAVAKSGQIRSAFEPANVNNLEGLTWPDTYFISEGEDEAAILKRLVSTFDKNANALGVQNSTQNGVTPYQTIIVASLIQTEAKVEEDRALIASVIYNRLRDKMPLQIDATLLYARGDKSGPIRNSEKAGDSPYNTYKVNGLPPTPISTVSAASLKAAMNPAKTNFKFYVLADKNGKHAFSATLAEHEKLVAEARKKGLL